MAKQYKITFKKDKPSTGLASVGEGTPGIDIKYRGICIGRINFNNHWNSKIEGIRIRLKKKKEDTASSDNMNCPWEWVTMKYRPVNEADARAKIQEMRDQILEIVYLENDG